MATNIQRPPEGAALMRNNQFVRLRAIFWLFLLTAFAPNLAHALDTICARVKIVIKQELTFVGANS